MADALSRKDGGRDLPNHKHPRTHTQRMYDAFHQLITGATQTGTTKTGNESAIGSSVRNMMHVFITVDDDDDADLVRAHAPNGDGFLPVSVLERYSCDAMFGGTVFSRSGEVLWHGRKKRSATPGQISALIARDRGCVVCSAEPSRCEAHHLDPYNSPKQGETNVDEMALICADCHHWLHEEQLTLYWQLGPPDPVSGLQTRSWQTRPAHPDEVAHDHGGHRQSGDRGNRQAA